MNDEKPNISPTFVTLGPQGTNHEMITRRYLAFRGIKTAKIQLVDDFRDGLKMMAGDQADFMVQVAVHPDCADIVASAHFEYGLHVVDTFISPSKELAILTRKEIDRPKSLALQPATRSYADLTGWDELIPVSSIMRVAEGLMSGQYDSGLTALDVAEKHPDRFRIDVRIGTVDDPWIVFGKRRVSQGELIAWPESPIGAQIQQL